MLFDPNGDEAVFLGLGDGRVDIVDPILFALADASSAIAELIDFADELDVAVLLGDWPQHVEIVSEAIGAFLQERLQAVRDAIELQQGRRRYILLDPADLPGTLHDDDVLAGEICKALDGAIFRHEHVAAAPGIVVGEINHLRALRTDAEGGDDEVNFATLQRRDPVGSRYAG